MTPEQESVSDGDALPVSQQGTAVVAAVPDAIAIVFASCFIVAIARSAAATTLDIQIADRFGSQHVSTGVRTIDVRLADGSTLLCVALPVRQLVPVSIHAGKVQVDATGDHGPVFRGVMDVQRLEVSRGIDPVVVRILSTLVHIGVIDQRLAMIFDRSTRWLDPSEIGGYGIEAVYQSPYGALIDGWLENVGRRDLLFMSGDLTAMTPVSDFLTLARPDIDLALRQSPSGRSTGLMHGFLAPLVGCGEKNRSMYVLERLPDGGVILGPIPYEPVASREQAVEVALSRIGSAPMASADQARAVLKPFLISPNVELRCRLQRFGPTSSSPKLSIVVALSGDPLFVRSLIAQQEQFSEEVEWVLALQSSANSSEIIRQLAYAQAEFAQGLSLLEIDVDVTLPQILNLSVDHARGDYVLFLDEASWIDDARPITRALKDLENGSHDVLGLAMSLEDGSTDHLGLVLRPDRFQRNLVTVEAVGRGYGGERERRGVLGDVDGVSVGAMMVSRRVFHQLGGFDEELFTPNGFDLDFCLRLGAAGGRVGLVRNTSLSRGLKDHVLVASSEGARKAFELLDRFTLAERYSISRLARRQLEGARESPR